MSNYVSTGKGLLKFINGEPTQKIDYWYGPWDSLSQALTSFAKDVGTIPLGITVAVYNSGTLIEYWNPQSIALYESSFVQKIVVGINGDSFEHIYKLTSNYSIPILNQNNQYINNGLVYSNKNYIPEGWMKNPDSVSSDYPYLWMATRSSTNGNWSYYKQESVALVGNYSKDGDKGDQGEAFKGVLGNTVVIYTSLKDLNMTIDEYLNRYPLTGDSYDFKTNNFVCPNGWSTTNAGLLDPVWKTQKTYYTDDTVNDWIYPVQIIDIQSVLTAANQTATKKAQECIDSALSDINSFKTTANASIESLQEAMATQSAGYTSLQDKYINNTSTLGKIIESLDIKEKSGTSTLTSFVVDGLKNQIESCVSKTEIEDQYSTFRQSLQTITENQIKNSVGSQITDLENKITNKLATLTITDDQIKSQVSEVLQSEDGTALINTACVDITNNSISSIVSEQIGDKLTRSAIIQAINNGTSETTISSDVITLDGQVIANKIATTGINIDNISYINGSDQIYDDDHNFKSGATFAQFGNSVIFKCDNSGQIGTNLKWDTNGNLTISGNITATSGNIGGWSVSSNELKKDSGTSYIKLNPTTGIQLKNTYQTTIKNAILDKDGFFAYKGTDVLSQAKANKLGIGLNSDGSGYLANGNISWNDSGEVLFGSGVTFSWQSSLNKVLSDTITESQDLFVVTENTVVPSLPTDKSTLKWSTSNNVANDSTKIQYVWKTTKYKKGSSTNYQYTTPSIIGVYGKDGENGTSINIKGSLNSTDELPSSGAQLGDAYIIGANLYVYTGTSDNCGFSDSGTFKGADGESSYIHIAWAEDFNEDGDAVGFTVSLDSNKVYTEYAYQGIYVNNNKIDSNSYSDYTWIKIKGNDGAPGDKGDDGLSIVEVTTYYKRFDDPIAPGYEESKKPTKNDSGDISEGWQKTIPDYVKGKYNIYESIYTEYSNASYNFSTPVKNEYVSKLGTKTTYIGETGIYSGTVAADKLIVGGGKDNRLFTVEDGKVTCNELIVNKINNIDVTNMFKSLGDDSKVASIEGGKIGGWTIQNNQIFGSSDTKSEARSDAGYNESTIILSTTGITLTKNTCNSSGDKVETSNCLLNNNGLVFNFIKKDVGHYQPVSIKLDGTGQIGNNKIKWTNNYTKIGGWYLGDSYLCSNENHKTTEIITPYDNDIKNLETVVNNLIGSSENSFAHLYAAKSPKYQIGNMSSIVFKDDQFLSALNSYSVSIFEKNDNFIKGTVVDQDGIHILNNNYGGNRLTIKSDKIEYVIGSQTYTGYSGKIKVKDKDNNELTLDIKNGIIYKL